MLTRKQHELLLFIHERLRESGVPPSFDEMKDALDLRSKSGIHRLITALEERGFIRRLPNRARALEVIRLPEQSTRAAASPRGGFTPERHRGQSRPSAPRRSRRWPTTTRRPICDPGHGPDRGRHADLRDPDPQPHDHVSAGHARRAASIRARSARRFDDRGRHPRRRYVVIRRQDIANTGDIIVALIDDEEATLKRLRRRGSSIALEAANPAYETRVLGPDRVRIQGKLVSLMRRY